MHDLEIWVSHFDQQMQTLLWMKYYEFPIINALWLNNTFFVRCKSFYLDVTSGKLQIYRICFVIIFVIFPQTATISRDLF